MDSDASFVLGSRIRRMLAAVAAATLLFSAGAAAQQKKEKMEVSTPWGGASVSGDAALKDLGLPAYPGARLYKEKPSDDPSATLSFWTPALGVKLVVVKYEADDPLEKVSEFYQKALAKHGKVLKCTAADKQAKAEDEDDESMELTCSDAEVKPGSVELRAGTKQRRHMVGITPKGKGCEFGLVYLEMQKKSKEPL
jgi:hypothetical protein